MIKNHEKEKNSTFTEKKFNNDKNDEEWAEISDD